MGEVIKKNMTRYELNINEVLNKFNISESKELTFGRIDSDKEKLILEYSE